MNPPNPPNPLNNPNPFTNAPNPFPPAPNPLNPPNAPNPANPPNPVNPAYNVLGFRPLQITGGAQQPALDTHLVTWANTLDDQPQSRLVQLPAELRRMIMRELLTAEDSIYERTQQPGQVPYTYDAAGRARDYRGRFIRPTGMPLAIGHGLTPAILRTCQKLHADGRSELYDRNVLQVDFYVGYCPGPVATEETICSQFIPYCTRCAIVTTVDDEILQQRDHQGNWEYDANIQRIVSRFCRMNWTIRVADNLTAYENARTLISYWAQTANMAQMELSVEVVSPPNAFGVAHTDVLQLFRLIRCASFKFSNRAALVPRHRGVEREVLSSLPILNFDQAWDAAKPLLEQLTTETLRLNNVNLHNHVRRVSNRLLRARAEFDAANFQQAYHHMLGLHNTMIAALTQPAQNYLNAIPVAVAARNAELTRTGTMAQDYQ